MSRKEIERSLLRVWGVCVWLVLPLLPRSAGMALLHRYLRTAYGWRTRWIPARAAALHPVPDWNAKEADRG